ncbi:protein farnesyltransferase/geranylgeranyltransferase type-1 subunit alpha-like [Sycon ciliatum]|uniref:protein farnesyltransferase/geranylgeranyltransferase type-1 subunit alpha-like n=1 Tax=Sycon ciliatum TaxID=27933 RepID=UPI0020ADDADF|eukprot:scpid48533/ scgid14380/ Protein farnesyltransferase/geranylgeranyltransferase type-1 subunit alpha; CAAX farnesyltransferase subunit alpha; FTase-alpha; Ras proteins prenyltransferase subunit alpha; Type I protein geranyl-geranyltransferase subunit alpha
MDDEDSYVLYRDREEWKDIEPVAQDDGPFPVVQIAYSTEFKDCYDYFRAILKKSEMSKRAYALTSDALKFNLANYTVWHYRRKLIDALSLDLKEELEFVSEVILDTPKNYQAWHHRQVIVEKCGEPGDELSFTRKILDLDAKNYHAWQHRQWVLRHFSLWENELQFVDTLLRYDLRNNSAWNERYYTVTCTTGFTDEIIVREVKYAMQFIHRAPNNESAWNYLQGVTTQRNLRDFPTLKEECLKMLENSVRSPYLLAFLVDLLEDEAENGDAQSLEKAKEFCRSLETQDDTIRKNYWRYRANHLGTIQCAS